MACKGEYKTDDVEHNVNLVQETLRSVWEEASSIFHGCLTPSGQVVLGSPRFQNGAGYGVSSSCWPPPPPPSRRYSSRRVLVQSLEPEMPPAPPLIDSLLSATFIDVRLVLQSENFGNAHWLSNSFLVGWFQGSDFSHPHRLELKMFNFSIHCG